MHSIPVNRVRGFYPVQQLLASFLANQVQQFIATCFRFLLVALHRLLRCVFCNFNGRGDRAVREVSARAVAPLVIGGVL